MKKVFPLILLTLCVCFSFAFLAGAEDILGREYRVYRCNEYITLREEPRTSAREITRIPLGATVTAFSEADNGFLNVYYDGHNGYALARYLTYIPAPTGVPMDISENQRKNLNLFLSNFTETSMAYNTKGLFDIQSSPESALIEFAVEHMWFNYNQSRIEWGEYANDCNVRVHKQHVPEIIEKYFGVLPHSAEPMHVDFIDPYYYWMETGGHTANGFASVREVSYLGGDRYLVRFSILAGGERWENADTALSYEDARIKFPYYEGHGYATVYAPNLNDRATYKLTRIISD